MLAIFDPNDHGHAHLSERIDRCFTYIGLTNSHATRRGRVTFLGPGSSCIQKEAAFFGGMVPPRGKGHVEKTEKREDSYGSQD